MTRKRPTSLHDIAKAVGVSLSLVSKVLGDKMGNTRARPEVVEAIKAKAREMNYQTNPLAFALKHGLRGAIGVLLHPVGAEGTETASHLLRGISSRLDEERLRLWLRFYNTDDEFLSHLDRRVPIEMDGIIVAGLAHQGTFDLISQLHKGGTPVVSIYEGNSVPGVPNIRPDSLTQGRIGTEHLLSQGCRRIATLMTGRAPTGTHSLRHQGYVDALVAQGISVDPALTLPADNYTVDSGERAVARLIENGISFDGVLAQSDNQAMGVVNELVRRGISVPGQVKVIGVDNSPLCENCIVPLSSVTADWPSVGRVAAEQLLAAINGTPAMAKLIPPSVVVRRSSL